MEQEKRNKLIGSMIIKSIVSLALMAYMLRSSSSNDSVLETVLSGFIRFLFSYALCSMFQIIRTFTYSFFATFASFVILVGSYFAWMRFVPDSDEFGIGFVISCALSIMLSGIFLFYDIFKLVPKPAFIQKSAYLVNMYEVIDIPEAAINAIIKLVYYIKETSQRRKQ